ncbi:ATP-dependent helicase [Candidatus Saccharibacteria bacterium]|nr:ATP-dependent helicase [Candidatus Saccharibacteria bacterium]
MPLNAKQKAAVEYIEGPLLVLAGPGTGKTHLLSNRVEHILKTTDVDPENILCLTYTENGASNMRTRLLATVGKGARKIAIHTYHAFGSDILSEYKNYAVEFTRNLDAPIDEVTQFKIVREIQDGLPALDILKTAKTSDITSTIAAAKSARLSGADLAKIAEKNIETSNLLRHEISPLLENLRPRMKFLEAVDQIYTPILEIFAKYSSNKPILGDIEPIANCFARDLKRLIDAEMEKEKPSISPLTTWKRANFELDDDGHYLLKDRISNLKLQSFSKILTAYDEKLEQDGLFDFADMIEQAIAILKKDKGFRLTLTERFQYILLDEFQDTNPSQFEIIKLLTDYEQPNVMAVGDDDQAIFEFQGADASNLLTFQQYYGAKVINLEENYRSGQEILDFSRHVADQIEDSFAKHQNVNKNLKAFKGKGSTIERHEFLTADSEYAFVAQKIEKLIKKGVPQKEIAIITPKHKYIAPLLPYLKESGKINIAYEKKDNLLDDPRLAEILTLARFVHDLSQGKNPSSRLLEILSFPFFKIDPATAIKNVSRAKADHRAALDYLIKSDSPELRDLGNWLAKLALLSFDTPLELMLDYLVGTVAVKLPADLENGETSKEGALLRGFKEFRSPFIEYYDAEKNEYETFELYENLAVLKTAILNHTKVQNPRLKDLILLLDDYTAAGAALMNTSPYRDSDDAIQIVTAHKSKGLEYEYVFLIATDNLSWGKAKGNNNMLVLPKNVIQIRHTGATEDERLRLFFVAVTRAKSTLIMTNSLKDFADKSPARLDYLEEYEDPETKEIISPFVGKVTTHYEDLDEVKKSVDLRKSWRAAYTKLTPELRPILKSRMENYLLSPSDLTSFIDISYGGPMAFYQNRILRAPQEPATGSMLLGTLIHSAFEKITKATVAGQDLPDETVIAEYRQEAEATDLEDKEIKYLLEKGEAALKISLDTFKNILRDKNARAEVNLFSEHPEIGGVPTIGIIDHMSINEEAKEIEIYDFKTGKYNQKHWGSVDTLYKYSLQLGMYKLMLESCPSFKKYRITKGHILFVTPDEEGKVHDKELDFAKDLDEKELVALCQAVYKQATTLAFLDDEELKLEPDKTASLTDIRKFIELLLAKTNEK